MSAATGIGSMPGEDFAEAQKVVQQRCITCHSSTPTEPMFPTAPNGVMFDSPEQIQKMAPRIKERVVVNRTMPFINKTGMAEEERTLLGRWVDEGASVQ